MIKRHVTSLLALGLIVIGYFWPQGVFASLILNSGLFALSGALTNWLAIHMLFERVPGLYGSGIVPARFEEFRAALKTLIMTQFFSEENLQRFFHRLEEEAAEENRQQSTGRATLDQLADRVDLNSAFESLVDAIMNSSFGNMLSLMGGRNALESLREPFTERMKGFLSGLGQDGQLVAALRKSTAAVLLDKAELLVDQRLDELSPELVKRLVQDLISEHLGWLVVWGGVLGGLIGFVSTLILKIF